MIRDVELDSQMEDKVPLFPLAGAIEGPASGDPHPTQCRRRGANLALSQNVDDLPRCFLGESFCRGKREVEERQGFVTEAQYPAFDKGALEFWSTFAMRADWDRGARRPDI